MKKASVRRTNALVVCAGMAASVAMGSGASAGVVTANWLSPVSGMWNTAANWSTNPNFPNNGTPPGETYHAVIDATGAAYTVTMTATTTVDQLTLDSADATLLHTSGGLTAINGLALNAGVFRLQNSTILNTAISSSGGSLTTSGFSSALIDVTLGAPLTIVGGHQMSIGGGSLILNNATVSIDGNGSFTSLNFNGNQVLGGSGVIAFNGVASNNAVRSLTNVQTLTIGEDVTIRTGTQGGTVGLAGATMVNQGTISAETAGRTLTVTGTNWSNTGLLRASAGTLTLEGSIAVGGLGQIEATGSGLIVLNGTLNNTGFTTVLDGVNSRLALNGGTISGGIVAVQNGGALTTSGFSSALTNVTLRAPLTIVGGHQMSIGGASLILDDATVSIDGNGSFTGLNFNGNQVLGGSGVIAFNGSASNNAVRSLTNLQTLAIGEDVTIRTGTQGGTVGLSTAGLVNQGTISAETAGRTLTVTGTNWSNTGLLRATTGTLRLEGSIAVGGLGTIEAQGANGGVIELGGTLQNSGATVMLDGANSRLTLVGGGSIVGGSVIGANGGLMIAQGGALNGVTLGATLTIANQGALGVSNGLTLDGGQILMAHGGITTQLLFNGNQTFGGSGEFVFNGTTSFGFLGSGLANQTLTIGEDVTIRTGTQGGTVGRNTATLVNGGTISAETAGRTLTVTGTNWSNTGLLHATTGTLRLEGSISVGGLGMIEAQGANGGVIELGGVLQNTGNTTVLDGANSRLTLVGGGSIVGGSVIGTNGGLMIARGGALNGVTLGAPLTIANQGVLAVSNGLTLDGGQILMAHGGFTTQLRFDGSQTFGGSGEFVFNGTTSSGFLGSGQPLQALTIGENVTIRTGTQGGAVGLNSASLVNLGTISAETASQTLEVAGANWSNSGLLRSSAGTLHLRGSGFTNTGTIRGEAAGTARITATGFNQQGTLEARSGGIVRVENGASLSNTGTLLAGTNGRIELVNGLTQTGSGTVEIELGGLAASQFGRLTITGAAALGGTLALTPVNGFAPDWGDAWTIMTFGSRTGDFASFDLPTLADADWTWWMEANAANYRVGVRHVADLNYDGAINFGDLNIVLGNYNLSGSALQGDISGDGLVNFADLNIVLGLFNLTAPTNVPAPGGVATLALVGLAAGRRRRG